MFPVAPAHCILTTEFARSFYLRGVQWSTAQFGTSNLSTFVNASPHGRYTTTKPMTRTFWKWLSFQSGCHGNQARPLIGQRVTNVTQKPIFAVLSKLGGWYIRTIRSKPWSRIFDAVAMVTRKRPIRELYDLIEIWKKIKNSSSWFFRYWSSAYVYQKSCK